MSLTIGSLEMGLIPLHDASPMDIAMGMSGSVSPMEIAMGMSGSVNTRTHKPMITEHLEFTTTFSWLWDHLFC